MKSQINFDTLEYMKNLKNSGLTEQQAEGITKATSIAFDQMIDIKTLANKTDLLNLELNLKTFIVKSLLIGISALGTIQALIQHFIH